MTAGAVAALRAENARLRAELGAVYGQAAEARGRAALAESRLAGWQRVAEVLVFGGGPVVWSAEVRQMVAGWAAADELAAAAGEVASDG